MSLDPLIRDDGDAIRTDLVVVAHSHPTQHVGSMDPRRFLLPSSTDLITYGENLASNPGLIEGTLATHHNLGGIALFLFKARNSDTMQRLQEFERGTTVNDALLATLGLRTATITYNRRTGTIRSGLATLHRLYE